MPFTTGSNLGFRQASNLVLAAVQDVTIIQFLPKTEWSTGIVAAFSGPAETDPIPLHIVQGVHPAAPTVLGGNVEFVEVTLTVALVTTLLLPLASDRNAVFASAKVTAAPLGSAPFWVAIWDGAALADRPTSIQYNVWVARRAGT